MRTTIIAIGNSRGIRIPKPLLEESGLGNEVELNAKPGEVRITRAKKKKLKIDPFNLASERSLAKDWLREEENKAWAVYQSDK